MIAIAAAAFACLVPLVLQSVPPPSGISRFEALTREGARLSKDQAASLEQALVQTPADLDTRAKLLGFYFSPASVALGPAARIQARRGHILWLVRGHPESPLLMSAEATLDPRGHALADPEGFEQVRAAWMAQTAKKDATAAVLANAARFFLLSDKSATISLYARARKLEPQNIMWVVLQGSAMAFAVVGIAGQNQNGFPSPADPVEAASDQARNIRRELETSNDTALLIAAAGELTMRGFMAQSMARGASPKPPVNALDLAETLLKRAQQLDPGKRESSLGLARIYELRAMSATSEEEKKTLALARYQQLIKGSEGLSPDDPASANQLVALARASVDAGDLDRAETLANKLLAQVPNLGSTADTISHHGHIILGRVALRRGNIQAAKAQLLDAGRVNGGGTLSSFGPNMTLAKELLEKNEKDTVLQYLELCRKFWQFSDRMDPWIAAINNGQIPNFGGNLNY